MIKVCHIVNLITGRTDGVYAHLKMIFENSDKTKFQHYLIFQGSKNIEKELSEIGVIVFVSASLKKKISLRTFYDVYRFLKSNNIDIVQAHLIKPYAISGLVNILLGKKFIFNYHGIFLKNNPYYSFIERSIYSIIHYLIFLFGRVNLVLAPSRKSKELLMMETKLFPEPKVYYNGYFLSKSQSESKSDLIYRIQQIKKDKLVIAVIGRLEIDKRVDKAINLLKKLIVRKKNIHLFIFGDGSLKTVLQNYIKSLNLISHVDLFGYVENIGIYYKLFDMVLFTSEWEGMPLTLWEAMANEVPVVAPDVGGFKEILEENDCGMIYQSNSLKDAENKIFHLLDDNTLRKIMGKNGRLAIESKYNVKNFINQIEQVYMDM